MRALVADADDLRRQALHDELVRHGHEVRVVDSVRDVLREQDAELIAVGDAPLGEDDPLDVLRGLRAGQRGEDDPIVLFVGDADEVDVVGALEAGAHDVWGLDVDRPDVPRDTAIRLSLAVHYARLQAEHVRVGGEFALLRRALDLTGTGFVLTDPRLDDNPIVYANEAFVELTGYPREEVLGRNCRFLQGDVAEPEKVDALRRAIRERRPFTIELLNQRRDGQAFHNEVHVSPVRDESGEVVRFVGVQIDVSGYRDLEASRGRSAFLAAASPVLDATLDLRTTLESIVRVSVPRLGDACLLDVVLDGRIERLACAAEDPVMERLLAALPETYRAGPDDPIVDAVAQARAVVLPPGRAAGVVGPGAGRVQAAAEWSAMVVPLRARGRALGALVLVGGAERELLERDLPLAEDLAHRAALAIDNARLYAAQRGVADALQRSLLPGRLPDLEGMELAARYRPFGEGMEIGGDFYDAFPARDGRTAVVVGDVSGKGAAAAAITGLARHTLRTAASYEDRPSRVLGALNRALLVDRAGRGRYCTVALVHLEREDAGVRATLSRAGHPTPWVVRADGAVERHGAIGMLLGYVEDPPLADTEVVLGPGDALVLYTDGVSEAYAPRRATGEEWVGELLEGAQELDADAIAARLERGALEAQDGRPRDDVAVAVVRVAA